jgi:phosphoglucosamine mutase
MHAARGIFPGREPVGHTIFLEHATTGDGQLTALQFLRVVLRCGKRSPCWPPSSPISPDPDQRPGLGPGGKTAGDGGGRAARCDRRAEEQLGQRGPDFGPSLRDESLIRSWLRRRSRKLRKNYASDLAELIKNV